jgi:hypothetical protein
MLTNPKKGADSLQISNSPTKSNLYEIKRCPQNMSIEINNANMSFATTISKRPVLYVFIHILCFHAYGRNIGKKKAF